VRSCASTPSSVVGIPDSCRSTPSRSIAIRSSSFFSSAVSTGLMICRIWPANFCRVPTS
jgi:hypothetical protein